MINKTIAAISTPPGAGGIAVIRISGKDAVGVADQVFRGACLAKADTHTVHYGHAVDKNGCVLDEVLATVMRAPRTFTREDIVEISTHGGVWASRRVLKAIMEAGAYPAEAGEFTKRAFLNGRIDLSQAEAVIDIINAKNELAQKNAVSQADGGLSAEIENIRDRLVALSAAMQVAIDYPDEDLEDITPEEIVRIIEECRQLVERLLRTADSGRLIRDGIATAIVGRPNVGKSSLLNRLAREDRAIVTDIAGTTRDVIEEFVDLDGVMLRLMDTAGIRETADAVEKIGVERSRRAAGQADLVLVVLDAAAGLSEEDQKILEAAADKPRIVLINKTDEKQSDLGIADAVLFSAKTGAGIEELSKRIRDMYRLGGISRENGAVVTNMRHVKALGEASGALGRAVEALVAGMPQDIVSIDISSAMDALGEITGATVSEDIVSAIFHNFCVGK